MTGRDPPPELTPNEAALLVALMRLAGGRGRSLLATNRELIAEAGLPPTSLAAALRGLEYAGQIRRVGRGRHRTIEVLE